MSLYGWVLARLASRLASYDKLYQVILWVWGHSPRSWLFRDGEIIKFKLERKGKIMAKPKRDIIVRIVIDNAKEARTGIIYVWANNIMSSDVLSIEGVESVDIGQANPAFVYVNARYDAKEVAAELEELLSAKVPSAFYGSPD